MATLHDYPLLGIAGIILLFAFLGWAALTDIPSALKTGKVKEFDRHRNTYNRKEEPFAFWSSIFIYVMIGGCCSALSMWAVFVFLERLWRQYLNQPTPPLERRRVVVRGQGFNRPFFLAA